MLLLILVMMSSIVFGAEFVIDTNKTYLSKRNDSYKMLENGDITKNGKVAYTFAGSISTNEAYYKMGAFWSGIQIDGNLMKVYPSFTGKSGVRFDKKPIAVLTNN